ncbi:MAG: hypothetical protein H6850_04235 [Alphaproteobacteria bacterium]|nr:MAG: hypothetical protein H6850_04235 [Alphaproteobacteria bacterium]
MLFLIFAEYNIGVIGGGSSHNLYVEKSAGKYKYINTGDDEIAGSNANGGYFKLFLNYQMNLMNNLDVKIELYGGKDFAKLRENEKDVIKPGIFFGAMAKGELDFYETYSLFAGIGLYCAPNFKIQHEDFHSQEKGHFLPTLTVSVGGSYYLNDRVSLCCEITHIGFWWGNGIKTEKGPKNIHQSGLRIGVGINVQFEQLPFLKR